MLAAEDKAAAAGVGRNGQPVGTDSSYAFEPHQSHISHWS
jgi:hypothetical protein